MKRIISILRDTSIRVPILVVLSLVTSISLLAREAPRHTHVHGQAELHVIYENKRLLLELETPAVNMLGFEHQPRTIAEWERLQALKQELQRPNRLFNILQAQCEIQEQNIILPFQKQGSHEEGAHKDIYLSYEWQCSGEDTPHIEVRLFEHFENFEEIHTQWVINGKQGASILNNKQFRLEFSQ